MLNKFFKKKPKSIRDIAVNSLYKEIEEYDKWYPEKGMYLPPDYATDPSGWNEVLHQMSRAFKILDDKDNNRGKIWDDSDKIKIAKLEEEIKSGLFLFGKYLYWLDDIIKK